MAIDVADLDPEFARRLNGFLAAAKAQGIPTHIISAYRDNALQAQLYSEMQAGKRAGPVAPPGGSYHNYGYAADVLPYDLSKQPALWALANQNPAYGLHALGAFDPPHIQMAGSLADLRANPPALAGPTADLSGWLGGSPLPAAAAQRSPPGTPTPGAALTSPMDLVANLESGNRNIPQAIRDKNSEAGTPAGGYFQIIDPTWRTYAGAVGVDVSQYPNAMSAPRDIQAKVASAIPVNQWGPNTVNALKSKFPGVDTSQTLGALQSTVLNGGSGAPGPMDPSAQAGGPGAPLGTPGSTVNPPIPTTPGTTINSTPMASLGGKMEGLATDLQKDLGKSDDAQKPPDIKPNIPPAPGARNVSPLLGNPQIYAQRMAGLNQPMTWGSAPPGQNPWTGYGIQTPVYGTSLMSNLQQFSDPTWMDQSYG